MAIAWTEAMFRKWYGLPNQPYGEGGVITTYSRIGFRYLSGPKLAWNYVYNPANLSTYFPDHPLNEYRWRLERLLGGFLIAPSDRILVLGCGSGFLAETFIWWKMQNGIAQTTAQAQVAGVDNSQFIQGNIASEAHPLMQGKVVNRDLLLGSGNAQMRGALRTAAGNSEFFDWVITESVVESYTDAERVSFMTAVESYQRNTGTTTKSLAKIIHMVYPLTLMIFDDAGNPIYDGWNPVPDGGAPNRRLVEWSQTRPAHSWCSCYGVPEYVTGTG